MTLVVLTAFLPNNLVHQLHHTIGASRHQRSWEAKEDVVRMCQKWYDYIQPGWCQPVRQEFMDNECEALPGVAYPWVRDNRSTLNTKTGYDESRLWPSLIDMSQNYCQSLMRIAVTVVLYLYANKNIYGQTWCNQNIIPHRREVIIASPKSMNTVFVQH